jgi:hypothetical protein
VRPLGEFNTLTTCALADDQGGVRVSDVATVEPVAPELDIGDAWTGVRRSASTSTVDAGQRGRRCGP